MKNVILQSGVIRNAIENVKVRGKVKDARQEETGRRKKGRMKGNSVKTLCYIVLSVMEKRTIKVKSGGNRRQNYTLLDDERGEGGSNPRGKRPQRGGGEVI